MARQAYGLRLRLRSQDPLMILSAAKLNRRSKGDFKGRNSEAALIPKAISRYPRQLLSYRDIKELLLVQRLEVDCSALNRWVLV
jgi:hypothetical protein